MLRLRAPRCRSSAMHSSDAPMNFSIVNLGCKVNRVESDDVAAMLLARGLNAVDIEEADLIIVNTCTVTGEAEKKTRKAVRHALRSNGYAQVIVTGCAAAIDASVYEQMSSRVRIVAKGDLMQEAAAFAGRADALRVGSEFPTRVGIKVQDGCNNACTYCIVHVARGRAWSRPASEVVEEVRAYAEAGAKEMVLTGINLGSYADSLDGRPLGLAGLLRLLLDAAPSSRFRISSIEPRDVDDDLIDLIAASDGRICRHLHLPLQSGSSKVLREMARPYDARRYAELVDRIRAKVPSMALSTDIIVGFPGETEKDFLETVEMVRRCRFAKVHAFRYSMRENTPAAARADQIAPEVKALRAKELERVAEEVRREDRALRAGMRELALVESDGVATTESYYTVEVGAECIPGTLVGCVL